MSNEYMPKRVIFVSGPMGDIEQGWLCHKCGGAAIYCSQNTECKNCDFEKLEEEYEPRKI